MRREFHDLLGVTTRSSEKQIHAAYRTAAKTAHPDAGGSQEAFERLKLARDVLTDRTRRRLYESTGEVQASVADNDRARVLACLSSVMATLLVNLDGAQTNLTTVDMADMLRRKFDAIIAEQEASATKHASAIARLTAMVGRWMPPGDEDPVTAVVQGQIEHLEVQKRKILAGVESLRAARELVRGYGYRYDRVIVPTMVVLNWVA